MSSERTSGKWLTEVIRLEHKSAERQQYVPWGEDSFHLLKHCPLGVSQERHVARRWQHFNEAEPLETLKNKMREQPELSSVHSPVGRRNTVHQLRSCAVLGDFSRWLRAEKCHTLPRRPMVQAVTYCLNRWQPLTQFLENGRLQVDANRSDRAIKSLCDGSQNWRFANTFWAHWAHLETHSYLQYLFEPWPQYNLADVAIWADCLPRSPTLSTYIFHRKLSNITNS